MYKHKIIKYIKENNLIKKNDKVLVALSGGPDSMCLLNILYELQDELSIELGAAHINHMLRGKEADEDQKYVEKICKDMGIPCFVKKIDINKYTLETKMSSEEAGRKARYDFFDKIIAEEGYTKVATAHNANDQAETIIFRLIRGSGLEGLGGIKCYRDKKIIRPILCLSRDEVEKYIENKKLNPRIDKTNFEKTYNRNKIRLDILPYIKENFNKNIIETLNRTALQLQKDNLFLEEEARKLYDKYCIDKHEYFIIKKETFINNEAILTRLVRNALMFYSNQYYDFEMKHIYDVINLAHIGTGKVLNLPNNIIVENVYGDIYIRTNKIKFSKLDNDEIIIEKNCINNKEVQFNNYSIKFEVINNKQMNLINDSEKMVRYLDFDKLDKNIIIRNRMVGDKIKPLGMNNNKKLKDVFINMKIPKDLRDSIPLICFDDNIAYIVGYKLSEDYKVMNISNNILKITAVRKE